MVLYSLERSILAVFSNYSSLRYTWTILDGFALDIISFDDGLVIFVDYF